MQFSYPLFCYFIPLIFSMIHRLFDLVSFDFLSINTKVGKLISIYLSFTPDILKVVFWLCWFFFFFFNLRYYFWCFRCCYILIGFTTLVMFRTSTFLLFTLSKILSFVFRFELPFYFTFHKILYHILWNQFSFFMLIFVGFINCGSLYKINIDF